MAVSPPLSNKPKRSWRKRLVYLCVLALALAAGLYVLRVPLFSGLILNSITQNLAKQLNADVHIESLDGSWISDARIQKIQIRSKDPDSCLQALSIGEIAVSYNLWGIINGASLADLSDIAIHSLDIDLQASKQIKTDSATGQEQLPFDPSFLASLVKGPIPTITVNGHCSWQQSNMTASSNFSLTGDNHDLILALSDSIVGKNAYEIGLINVKRIDPETFHLNAANLHSQINIINAKCSVTAQSIDVRLPFTVANQRQSLTWRYTKREQDLSCHLDFHWNKTPALLRSFLPHMLPQQGHSRLIASLHHSPEHFDISCMLHADDLLWQLNEKQQLKASIHSFIKNAGTHCSIEISDIELQTEDHHISISDDVHIRSEDHKAWRINKTRIKTSSGELFVEGVLSPNENDISLAWEKVNIGVLCKAFNIQHISGFCDGSLYWGGSFAEPRLDVKLSAPNLDIYQRNMQIDIACSQDENGINIDHCYAIQTDYAEAVLLGSWPRRISINGWEKTNGPPPEATLNIEAKNIHTWPELNQIINQGNITLDAKITAPDGNPHIQGSIQAHNVSFAAIEDHQAFAFNGSQHFLFNDTTWETDGTFTQHENQFIKNKISVVAPTSILDLPSWKQDWDQVIQTMQGTINLQDLHFKLIGAVPRIGEITGTIQLDGRRVQTDLLTASLGYEPVTLNGFVDIGYPHIQAAQVQVQGNRALIVQSPDFRLRANCNLKVSKDKTTPLRVAGDLEITEALYSAEFITTNRHTPEVDTQFQLFSLPESFLGGANLDINASAHNSIIIHNSMMHAKASGELKIRGTGMVPEPSGDILIHEDGARLSLPFATVWFKPSTITFKASEPFDPSFAINGQTKMQGYNLRILLKGKMSTFSVNGIDIVSNPPISPEEATRLITTGVPPRDIFDNGKDIDTSGLVIGWAIVETMRKVFGNGDPQREKLIDRLEVQIGRDVSNSGLNTIEVIAPLFKNYFIKIERDKYEDFNADFGIKTEW